MQRKLNDEFIREYSEEFSEKASSTFFASNNSISGKEILSFTPSAQVNFFVLKSLFRKWQQEMKSLESPFFNYKNAEVRKAMVQFMNTLSQHIEVKREAFQNILEEAVAETILLSNDPAGYIIMEFETLDVPVITEKVTRPILKYIKVHKETLKELFEENEGASLDDFLANAEDLMEDLEAHDVLMDELSALSEILPINEDELFGNEDTDFDEFDNDDSLEETADLSQENELEDVMIADDVISVEETLADENNEEESRQKSEPEEQAEPVDQLEEKDNNAVDEPNNIISESSDIEGVEASLSEDNVDEFKVDEASDEDDAEVHQEDPKSQEVAASNERVSQEEIATEDAPEDTSASPATLNDTFSKEETSTLAEKLENKKVESIMEAISVNHRYMFTKELFDGDREAFAEAINNIDSSASFDDAVELLVQRYAKELSWDMNSDEVKELLKVVFRKFR